MLESARQIFTMFLGMGLINCIMLNAPSTNGKNKFRLSAQGQADNRMT